MNALRTTPPLGHASADLARRRRLEAAVIKAIAYVAILAYGLNGKPLPVENGAPLRLRVERQLGYKMAKYVHSIELADDFSSLGHGKGGYWEDRGYDWYAGI